MKARQTAWHQPISLRHSGWPVAWFPDNGRPLKMCCYTR